MGLFGFRPMFYVYILYSASADKFYVGQTHDVELRLSFHNELSDHSFTSRFRPWQLRASKLRLPGAIVSKRRKMCFG
jgi:predicted GIY-YIG superfamily endonuclease